MKKYKIVNVDALFHRAIKINATREGLSMTEYLNNFLDRKFNFRNKFHKIGRLAYGEDNRGKSHRFGVIVSWERMGFFFIIHFNYIRYWIGILNKYA